MRLATRSFALFVLALAAVSAASASSFPGKNGKLVYSVSGNAAEHLVASKADGSKATKLTSPTAKAGDLQPRVSADGKEVVFIRDAQQGRKVQIWIVSIAGRRAHQVEITGLPTKTSAWAPTFTPDGKTILFELDNRNSVAIGIWKVAAKGGKASQVLKGNDSAPTVSPNGKKLAFAKNGELEIATIRGTGAKTVYNPIPAGEYASAPDFSPDGEQLAFVLANVTNGADIAVVSSAGGNATNLTNNGNADHDDSPAFSPDGTTIAFVYQTGEGKSYRAEIDSVPAAGGPTSVLVPKSSTQFPGSVDWQPAK